MTPDLTDYDVVLVNSSAGKDSQAMLDLVVGLADEAGVRDRIVVVHADLGRVEWPGTKELAAEHAAHYGLRFEVVSRAQGDLLHQLEHQRKMFPDAARRWCTSDQKTGQVRRLITALVTEQREAGIVGRKVKILNCLGMRAQESPARAKKPPFESEKPACNGKRQVDRWLPLHTWTEDQVWARCESAGTRIHYAYTELNMPRLSCCMCILASKSALLIGAKANPGLADEYVRIERKLGHSFRKGLTIESVVDEARRTDTPVTIESWAA